MATALKGELCSLREKVSHFAEQNIAHRADLYTSDDFPFDIWHKMAEERLLGVAIPEEYGGLGGKYLSIVVGGEAIVQRGHNMGLGLSWQTHQAVSRFFMMGFGTSEQKKKYLPAFANGRLTASVAVSEPERGAHPKYLKTAAYQEGDFYVLNGEKYYLTNGPIADLFLVCAITGVDGTRKQFTVFIVPKGIAGLSLTEPMRLTFLRPCPHCGITLMDCSVSSSNILGERGSAYTTMVVPFREVEDILSMGLITGGMEAELELVTGLVQAQDIAATDKLKDDLGELQSLVDTLRIVAYEAGSMLDSDTSHPELRSLPVSFGSLATKFQSLVEAIISRSSMKSDSELDMLANDLAHATNTAKNVAVKQRKLGDSLLLRKVQDNEGR